MDYPPTDIDRLITLHLSRQATEGERKQLQEWLDASPTHQEIFDHIKSVWTTPSYSPDLSDINRRRDEIWKSGTEQDRKDILYPSKNFDIFYWSKVAASFLLLLLGSGLLLYWVLQDQRLAVQNAVEPTVELTQMVEEKNPAGQKTIHTLPDGTRVWLNAESSLTYPEKFTDTLRLVQLSGEAFFVVAKDTLRPFIVATGKTQTQALGTEFNIYAYPEEQLVRIALLEGKVRVQDQQQIAILLPGEELWVTKDEGAFRMQQFDYDNTFGWKDGLLVFDGTDFSTFRRTIEKWYGVKVEVNGQAPRNWHIRARYQQEDLRHILRDICFNKNIKFELQDKHVLLTF